MAIAIPTLALLVLAIALPNYVAIRYAVFGGSPVAPVTDGAVAGGPTLQVVRPSRRARVARLTQRGYSWKMLSPIIFSISVILGLAVGGAGGGALVVLALLNLIWGALGWEGYIPGRK